MGEPDRPFEDGTCSVNRPEVFRKVTALVFTFYSDLSLCVHTLDCFFPCSDLIVSLERLLEFLACIFCSCPSGLGVASKLCVGRREGFFSFSSCIRFRTKVQ